VGSGLARGGQACETRRVLLARRQLLLAALGAPLAAPARALADAPGGASPTAAPAATPAPAGTGAKTATPTSTDLDFRDITVGGDRKLGRRFLLCVPKHLKAGEKVPLVVLLHGLGETGDERMGAYAWVERYGLATAYERLRKTPIARTGKRKDWSDARLAEVNAALTKQAFGGLCLVCPYTPNVHKLPDPSGSLDAYSKWITDVVLPRVRKDAPVHTDAARTAIDGCSLGGHVALEVFLRRPDAFGALGGVQSAVSEARAPGYVDRLAAALAKAKKPVHLLTSEGDPFLPGNKKIAAGLAKKGVACDLRVIPGPHDQPWLREAGTIEMLLWHDRRKKTA
jgi:enterochelin esterase-like enzyme